MRPLAADVVFVRGPPAEPTTEESLVAAVSWLALGTLVGASLWFMGKEFGRVLRGQA